MKYTCCESYLKQFLKYSVWRVASEAAPIHEYLSSIIWSWHYRGSQRLYSWISSAWLMFYESHKIHCPSFLHHYKLLMETQLWQPDIYRLLFHISASPTHFPIAMAGRNHRCRLGMEAAIARFTVSAKTNEKPLNRRGNSVCYDYYHVTCTSWLRER